MDVLAAVTAELLAGDGMDDALGAGLLTSPQPRPQVSSSSWRPAVTPSAETRAQLRIRRADAL